MYLKPLVMVGELLDEANARRAERKNCLPEYTDNEFKMELSKLRKKIQKDRELSRAKRGSAWTPLENHELALLERQMKEYEKAKTLVICPEADDQLNILRVNIAAGKPIVDGATFRDVAHELFRNLSSSVLQFIDKPEDIAVVLPLRAALACATTYHDLGVRNVGLIGVARNEDDAEPEMCYYERAPTANPLSSHYLIVDPMLATGGSLEKTILWLTDMGVPLERIIVQCVIAAPEGVDRILSKYPSLRILTAAVDGGLDKNAYIKDVGIGDFGDHYMRDMSKDFMQQLWQVPGILTENEIKIVLQRTASIIAK